MEEGKKEFFLSRTHRGKYYPLNRPFTTTGLLSNFKTDAVKKAEARVSKASRTS
jgi:hypothetical protein